MQIETLKVFCDLVDTESFSEAARRNQITQSAVSQQIRNLEVRYGVRFFERSRKNFSITPEGETFHQYARDIFETYREIEVKLGNLGETVKGSLNVGVIASFGLHDLPAIEAEYRSRFPDVKIEATYARWDEIYDLVLEGRVDIGIVAYPKRRAEVVIDLFNEQPLVALFPPDHSFSSQATVSLKDFRGEKFLAFEAEMPTRKSIDRAFRKARVDIEPALEFDNVEMLKRAVRVVGGVAIVPESSVVDEVKDGTFGSCPLDATPQLVRPLAALRRKGKPTSHALQEFLALLKKEETPASKVAEKV